MEPRPTRPQAPAYLPVQSAPVPRVAAGLAMRAGAEGRGVVPAQSGCEDLTGLAQQMCYAVIYGV